MKANNNNDNIMSISLQINYTVTSKQCIFSLCVTPFQNRKSPGYDKKSFHDHYRWLYRLGVLILQDSEYWLTNKTRSGF